MKTARVVSVALAVGLFALALWLVLRSEKVSVATVTPTPTASVSVASVAPSVAVASGLAPTVAPAATPLPARATPFVASMTPSPTPSVGETPEQVAPGAAGGGDGSNGHDPQIEIGKVRVMIKDFHTIAGENPVGTNAEIMSAIMGGNKRQAKLGPPEGMSLNGKGELVDQWGTPYFFHQLSKDVMEVHSAGPDKVMGTPDDVVIR